MRRTRGACLLGTAAATVMLIPAGPAMADHDHVMQVGNGQCVNLAHDGQEKEVQLPGTEEFEANRRHPLHVNVHLGEPGTRHGQPVIFVAGSDEAAEYCDGYVNP
jgi:hypothetical protein